MNKEQITSNVKSEFKNEFDMEPSRIQLTFNRPNSENDFSGVAFIFVYKTRDGKVEHVNSYAGTLTKTGKVKKNSIGQYWI